MYDLSVCRPARIPAQIVSGIGFLGAGTILVTKEHQVKGLTTAAGLWCCAAVGISVGSGFYYGAIFAGILIVVSLRVFSIVDKNFLKYNKYMNFYVEYNSKVFIRELIFYAKKSGYQILDLEITKDSSSGTYFATFQHKDYESFIKDTCACIGAGAFRLYSGGRNVA